MVNQAGEWIIARRDDFDKFHSYKLQPQNEFYKRLKAKHFLTVPEEKEQVLDLLTALSVKFFEQEKLLHNVLQICI